MSRLSAALVVDTDPKGLEALSYGFQGEGCRVASVSDHAAAAGQLGDAQLAVVVLRDPPEPGLALARALRFPAGGPSVPVLVLGAPALRQEARSQPGLEFLPLPCFVRDVLTAGKLSVSSSQVPGSPPGEEA